MIYLDKLSFIVTMTAVVLICMGVKWFLDDRPNRYGSQRNYNILMASLLFVFPVFAVIGGFILYSNIVYWGKYQSFHVPGWIGYFNRASIIQFPLALLCGAALFITIEFFRSDRNKTVITALAASIPFVFLFSIGFFSHELRAGYSQLVRLNVSGFEIEFNRPVKEEARFFTPGPRNRLSSISTHFASAVDYFKDVTDRTHSDLARLALYCRSYPKLRCQNLESIENLFTRGISRKGECKPHEPCEFEAVVNGALELAEPLAKIESCLRKYARVFPNGVPLQDEFSELAVVYSNLLADIERDPAKRSEARNRLEKVLNKLGDFRGTQFIVKRRDGKIRYERFEDVKECRDLKRTARKSAESITRHIKDLLKASFVHPIAPLLGSAVLTAAGSPYEAAFHLERRYIVLRQQFLVPIDNSTGKREFPDSEMLSKHIEADSFIEFLFRMRMLAALERLFDWAGEPGIAVKYMNEIAALTDDWLNEIGYFGHGGITEFVNACAENKITPLAKAPGRDEKKPGMVVSAPNDSQPNPDSLLNRLNSYLANRHSDSNNKNDPYSNNLHDVDEYFGFYAKAILWYTVNNRSRFYYIKQSDGAPKMVRSDLEDSASLASLAVEENGPLKRCFRRHRSDYRIERFYLLSNHGIVTLRYLDQLREDGALEPERELRKEVCDAQKSLKLALSIAREITGPDSRKQIAWSLRSARRGVKAIEREGIIC